MRKLIAALAVTGATMVGALVAAGPASADTAPQATCPYYHLCVFANANYTGGQVNFEFSNPNWRNIGPSWITNNDQSWFNNGAPGSVGYARVYANTSYGSRTVCMAPGFGIAYTSSAFANNNGESNNWGPSC